MGSFLEISFYLGWRLKSIGFAYLDILYHIAFSIPTLDIFQAKLVNVSFISLSSGALYDH